MAAGQGNVFEDFLADGAVAADGEVGFALDQQELPVGGGEAGGGVVDLFGRVDGGELGEDQRHDRALPEAGDYLARGVGEQGGVVLLRLVEGAGEVAGLVDGVGVGEEEPGAARLLGAEPAGVGLAGKASAVREVEGWGFGYKDAIAAGGCGFGDLAGGVGGVVVDDDHFPLLAEREARLGLGEQRLQTGTHGCSLIAGGHDDGEPKLGL